MILSRIGIYPIKALDGVEVASARLTPGGALLHDRAWAIMDADGRVVNGKRSPGVHRIRSAFSGDFAEVEMWITDEPRRETFVLSESGPLARWLGDRLGFAVSLRHDEYGFPDDRKAAGPTVASEESLAAVAAWFPEAELRSVRGRFRTNLELAGGGAFAEDLLLGAGDERKPFCIGEVKFFADHPCQRCVVPTRDPNTGETIAGFQRRFMARRAETLPAGAPRERFDHFYRFAVNTSVPRTEVGKTLRVGDELAR